MLPLGSVYGDSEYLNVEEHISDEKKKEGREYKINSTLESRARFRSRKTAVPNATNTVSRLAKTANSILHSHWRIFIWLTRKTCWLDEVRPAELKQVGYISLGIYLVFSVHCAVLP